MAHSQFSLTWDSHKNNICGGFCALQQNGEFVDMTLAADGHFVKVHQVLMALSSPYIKELITSAPCQHPVVYLNNVTKSTLTLLLEYIYTGEVMVPPTNLTSFIETAKSLQIKGLESLQSEKTDAGLVSTHTTGDNLAVNRKRKNEDAITDQTLKLPNIARKIAIKTESSSNISTLKAEENVIQDDSGNDYCVSYDTHNSDEEDTEIVQDINKSSNTGLKSSNLQFTVSIRGSLQVILNRFMYNLQSTQSSGVKRWRCIDYRSLKCMAFVITRDNVVINRGNPHCHSFHDKKILQKIEHNAVYSALYELEAHREREREKTSELEETTEYVTTDLGDELTDLNEDKTDP
ncbi:unnamed protein product [Leptosia nina]|uniref:BTB domain-containing protein n=1 Tax=Leptosia nina TaxID=320188 RepID=A0AAV1IW26_9NEOP